MHLGLLELLGRQSCIGSSPAQALPPAPSLSHLFSWWISVPLLPNPGLTYVYFYTLLPPEASKPCKWHLMQI